MSHVQRKAGMPLIHPYAAGIDIGSQFHVVAVPAECDHEPVHSFQTFTGDWHQMACWLAECKSTTIAMESTGIYWLPAFEVLENAGFEVFLVNAREAKNALGRKTDVNDAQWLQKLHALGLLRASFRPKHDIAALRCYWRQRERLIEFRPYTTPAKSTDADEGSTASCSSRYYRGNGDVYHTCYSSR